jgi:hypothetical protein
LSEAKSGNDIADFSTAPGFHGACHRAGHFGPDPLVQPGLQIFSIRPRLQKEAERRETLFLNRRVFRRGARLAIRARLSAFHCGSRQGDFRRPRLSVRPCFPGQSGARDLMDRQPGRRPHAFPVHDPEKVETGFPKDHAPTNTGVTRAETCPSAVSTSRAGRNAGRMMPEPPGSKGDEPLPAGTAPRSASRSDRLASLTGARRRGFYSSRDGCQGLSSLL